MGCNVIPPDERLDFRQARSATSMTELGRRTGCRAPTAQLLREVRSRGTDVHAVAVLQGALAQFSRSNLAQDLGRRLVADFAANLNARLTGTAAPQAAAPPLNVGGLIWRRLRERIRRLFGG